MNCKCLQIIDVPFYIFTIYCVKHKNCSAFLFLAIHLLSNSELHIYFHLFSISFPKSHPERFSSGLADYFLMFSLFIILYFDIQFSFFTYLKKIYSLFPVVFLFMLHILCNTILTISLLKYHCNIALNMILIKSLAALTYFFNLTSLLSYVYTGRRIFKSSNNILERI